MEQQRFEDKIWSNGRDYEWTWQRGPKPGTVYRQPELYWPSPLLWCVNDVSPGLKEALAYYWPDQKADETPSTTANVVFEGTKRVLPGQVSKTIWATMDLVADTGALEVTVEEVDKNTKRYFIWRDLDAAVQELVDAFCEAANPKPRLWGYSALYKECDRPLLTEAREWAKANMVTVKVTGVKW